jgi:hypothetical protein
MLAKLKWLTQALPERLILQKPAIPAFVFLIHDIAQLSTAG